MALCLAATLAAGLAWKNGHSWDKIREAVVAGIASALQAVFILFAVGALIGTWAMSGTLVAMVYYAMGILSPNFFYLTACVVSALVALSIGSSWTVAGTIGVGLMGIAEQMDLSPCDYCGRGASPVPISATRRRRCPTPATSPPRQPDRSCSSISATRS